MTKQELPSDTHIQRIKELKERNPDMPLHMLANVVRRDLALAHMERAKELAHQIEQCHANILYDLHPLLDKM